MASLVWILLFIIILLIVTYKRASIAVATLSIFVYLLFLTKFAHVHIALLTTYWVIFLLIALLLNLRLLRRALISKYLFSLYRKLLPKISETEKQALEAGTVDWDGEVFSGMPNWKKLLAYPAPKLTKEEQKFLDGPVDELCRMVNNWEVTHHLFNLTDETWTFIKNNGFFGMIIPKKQGGKEFSALAHSAVITKLAGHSISAAIIVGVPNSLGPAELLLEYGTKEQKDHYLPRLAKGEEIPCFALTAPDAGSDATAMPDYGVVCYKRYKGKKTLGVRLNWNKRYITLAPVATLLGLGFKLYDPDHLIGDKEDIGITCALIPTDTPGVTIGRRHFPLNSAFPNGPTQGKNVFIPIDWIIGGQKMAGQGWRMLIERLSVGRSISLPSSVLGGAKVASYAGGAYARIRKQFNLPIGKFEGVAEALARIAGHTYMMDALRLFAVSAVDRGEKPAVPSAIAKYHNTEMGRKIVNDVMDIHGGKGICLGPKNYLGRAYQEMPIAITVEGANILTRSMMIFGQGAVRCHPFVFEEMQSISDDDLRRFDKAIFGHIGFTISSGVRALLLGLSHGLLAGAPHGPTRRYYQHLSRFSAAFAFVADLTIITLGGSLKRREKISARLGDVLSMIYIGTAVLKHFEDQGRPTEDMPIIQWVMQYILFNAQLELHDVLKNTPCWLLAFFMRCVIFPLGRRMHRSRDRLDLQVADLLLKPTSTRERLAEGAYIRKDPNNMVGKIDTVLRQVIAAEPYERKFSYAEHENKLAGYTFEEKLKSAVGKGILTEQGAKIMRDAEKGRQEVIAVDDFSEEELGFVKK